MTTASPSQGDIGIERMCQLVGISRSGYYRRWQRSAPRQEETGLRDAIQRLALTHRHYGYRRIGALLRREGWQADHKRVLRLMREDNLLLRQTPFVPMTANFHHSWCVVPNLTRGIVSQHFVEWMRLRAGFAAPEILVVPPIRRAPK